MYSLNIHPTKQSPATGTYGTLPTRAMTTTWTKNTPSRCTITINQQISLLHYATSYAHAQVEEGSRIGIQFEEFDLENEENCGYDSVEGDELFKILYLLQFVAVSLVWDYYEEKNANDDYEDDAPLAKLCGSGSAETLYSTANEIEIHFMTDGDVTATGFLLKWWKVKSNIAIKCQAICLNN